MCPSGASVSAGPNAAVVAITSCRHDRTVGRHGNGGQGRGFRRRVGGPSGTWRPDSHGRRQSLVFDPTIDPLVEFLAIHPIDFSKSVVQYMILAVTLTTHSRDTL